MFLQPVQEALLALCVGLRALVEPDEGDLTAVWPDALRKEVGHVLGRLDIVGGGHNRHLRGLRRRAGVEVDDLQPALTAFCDTSASACASVAA